MLYKLITILNVILILFSFGSLFCSCGKLFAGPFDIKFVSSYLCDYLGERTWYFPTKFSKINRTHLSYTGNMTMLHAFNDDLMVFIEVSVFGNGGWRPNYYVIQLDHGCSDTEKLIPGFLESFFGAAGLKNVSCPIPAGQYFVDTWIFYVNLATKILPYNKYRATWKLVENKKIHCCGVIEIDVVPKKE